MPDISSYREIWQSDLFAYQALKNEFEKYESGNEHGLPAEHRNLPIDSEIIKLIEENEMNTDPDTLRDNFNKLVNKISKVFGAIKPFMITIGQNLTKRDNIYNEFERVHPTKLVMFHKRPLWYQFMLDIASHGGRMEAALLIELYHENYNNLINLALDHGFVTFLKGGDVILMRPDVMHEILFREYALPTTPQEVHNKNVYNKMFLEVLSIIKESHRDIQLKKLSDLEEELLSTDIKSHVELGWIEPLLKNNIRTVHNFVATPPRELSRILDVSLREINIAILSMVSYFKIEVKNLSIDVFDFGIYMNMEKEVPNKTLKCLHDNNIHTWEEFFNTNIEKINTFSSASKVNLYRLMSFYKWFIKLVKSNGRFYYQPIYDEFPYHEHLTKKHLEAIKKTTNSDPKEYLQIDKSDKVRSSDKQKTIRSLPGGN